MTNTLRSLSLLAVTAVMAATAQAAPITYNFTGTYSAGDTYFGTTVTGTITLDLAALPSSPGDNEAEWRNVPGIKITATATNFNGGTGKIAGAVVDDTVVQQVSFFPVPAAGGPIVLYWSWFGFSQIDGSDAQGINFEEIGPNYTQLGMLNKLIDPVAPPLALGDITLYDSTHGASFTIGSFIPATTNIVINGVDTGIKDFTYQGQSVNATLAGYATSAKNHGDYVSSVTQLTNDLKKAGLLTDAQKSTLTNDAAQSSIGNAKKK